jgi:hypothetical protein
MAEDLRERLEREAARVSLGAGAAGRMYERRDRRVRRIRIVSVAVGLGLVLAVVMIALQAVPHARPGRRLVPDISTVAGSYRTRLASGDADVARLGLAGTYEMRLRADGSMTVITPFGVDIPDSAASFSITGHQLRTDFLVGAGCGTDGTYRWSLAGGALRLVVADDVCARRATMLATAPWRPFETTAGDPLEGQWRASFSCRSMVGAVRAADASPHDRRFWLRATADENGATDPRHPCGGSSTRYTFTFRFTEGRLQIFDRTGAEGFDGVYAIAGSVVTVRDPRTRNIDGAYRFAFRLEGGRVTFRPLGRAATDPFYVGVWAVEPFDRLR